MTEWKVDYTDLFGEWWQLLSEKEQVDVAACVKLLRARGPMLGFPHSSGINESKHSHMRELRIQHRGRPYRVLYAFDPERAAILLLGGDKTGNKRWYEQNIPIADKLYDDHLKILKKGKNNMAKSFKLLEEKMSSKARAMAESKAQKMLKEMPIQELRQARHLSQEKLAKILDTKQANVSQIERRTDMYISTLRSYIEAMGGQLKIVAQFPDGDVMINQFHDINVG